MTIPRRILAATLLLSALTLSACAANPASSQESDSANTAPASGGVNRRVPADAAQDPDAPVESPATGTAPGSDPVGGVPGPGGTGTSGAGAGGASHSGAGSGNGASAYPGAAEQAPVAGGVTLRWEDGLEASLVVTGLATVPEVRLELRSGDAVVAEADARVVDGRFTAILLPSAGESPTDLLVTTGGPDPQLLARVPVPEPWVGTAWSANFNAVQARLLDDRTVLVSGAARVWEGVFTVEVRAGGQVIAGRQVTVAEGAPSFSPFEEEIALAEPVTGEGLEVWLLTQSPRDGSVQVELITPVGRGK